MGVVRIGYLDRGIDDMAVASAQVQQYIRSINVRVADSQSVVLVKDSVSYVGYGDYRREVREPICVYIGGAEYDAEQDRVWMRRVDGGGPVSFSQEDFVAACRAAYI